MEIASDPILRLRRFAPSLRTRWVFHLNSARWIISPHPERRARPEVEGYGKRSGHSSAFRSVQRVGFVAEQRRQEVVGERLPRVVGLADLLDALLDLAVVAE